MLKYPWCSGPTSWYSSCALSNFKYMKHHGQMIMRSVECKHHLLRKNFPLVMTYAGTSHLFGHKIYWSIKISVWSVSYGLVHKVDPTKNMY